MRAFKRVLTKTVSFIVVGSLTGVVLADETPPVCRSDPPPAVSETALHPLLGDPAAGHSLVDGFFPRESGGGALFSRELARDLTALSQEETGYSESRFRRTEIVFFISLPVSLLFSFLGLAAYRGASGQTGDLSSIEYQYLAISSLGISLSIALSDRRTIYGGSRR